MAAVCQCRVLFRAALLLVVLCKWSAAEIASASSSGGSDNDQFIVYKLDGVYNKLLRCSGQYEFIHCLQLFMVQRIERLKNDFGKSGDIKRDFLDKLFNVDGSTSTGAAKGSSGDDFEIRDENKNLTDTQLNTKLMHLSREYYFQNTRKARLEIIPGYSLDIKFPEDGSSQLITFALVRHSNDVVASGRQARRKKYDIDGEILKLGMPALMFPMIMVGAVFPFIYPMLKTMAFFSLIISKIALVGAAMYMAKNYYGGGGGLQDFERHAPPPIYSGAAH